MKTQNIDSIRFYDKCGSIITADEIGDHSEKLGYERLAVTGDLINRLIAGGYIVEVIGGAYRWPVYVTPYDIADDEIWAIFGCLNGLSDDDLDIYTKFDLEECTVPIIPAETLSLDKKRELSDTGACIITLHEQRYSGTLIGEMLNLTPLTEAGDIMIGPYRAEADAGIAQAMAEARA